MSREFGFQFDGKPPGREFLQALFEGMVRQVEESVTANDLIKMELDYITFKVASPITGGPTAVETDDDLSRFVRIESPDELGRVHLCIKSMPWGEDYKVHIGDDCGDGRYRLIGDIEIAKQSLAKELKRWVSQINTAMDGDIDSDNGNVIGLELDHERSDSLAGRSRGLP